MESMGEAMILHDISYYNEDELINKPEYDFLVQL